MFTKKDVRNATAADTLSVNSMKIYTRTGDKGETSLYGGKRISKSDLLIEAYGTLDELNSFIGLVANKVNKKERDFLITIQKDLYNIMANLSGAKIKIPLEKKILEFEKEMDGIDKNLPKLNRFIIPGGIELSSWFHILRTICRRAERALVRASGELTIIKYVNRLSDLFFMMARGHGQNKEVVL